MISSLCVETSRRLTPTIEKNLLEDTEMYESSLRCIEDLFRCLHEMTSDNDNCLINQKKNKT